MCNGPGRSASLRAALRPGQVKQGANKCQASFKARSQSSPAAAAASAAPAFVFIASSDSDYVSGQLLEVGRL